jgi:hypothetical protein
MRFWFLERQGIHYRRRGFPGAVSRGLGQPAVILLDTHVVLWLALEPGKISKKARATIEEARQQGEGLVISDISLLEIATLEASGAFS